MDSAPASLGEYLKSERERRGLSLEQVSSVTKIGVRILQALEQDRYSELPALPFVKGFIKTYCQLLQVSAPDVFRQYDHFLKEKSKSRPNREGGMSGYAFEKPEGEQAKRMLWAIMGVMLVFGVLVVLVFKPSLSHRKHGSVAKMQASPSPSVSPSIVSEGMPQPSGSPSVLSVSASPLASLSASPSPSASGTVIPVSPLAASPSPTLTPTPSPSASPTPSFSVPATPLVLLSESARVTPSPTLSTAPSVAPPPVPSPDASIGPAASPSPGAAKPDPLQSGVDYEAGDVKFRVVIRAQADVWVRYQSDDKTQMKFLLRQGRILILRGKALLRLQVSNPDAISISSNGRRYPTMSAIPQTFQYRDNATLVWPLEARERVQEIFPVTSPLPATLSPSAPPAQNAEPAPSVED